MHPIARYRRALGWSQAELAKRMKVVPNSVVGWEKGARPRPQTLRKLADLLGVNPLELDEAIQSWRGDRGELKEVA